MTATLTAAQIEQFHRDGFLFPVEAMSHEEIKHYRGELESLEQRYSQENHEHPIGHYLLGGSANVVLPLAAQLCSHRGILDAVESLLGPDLMAWGISFFIKEPGDGKIVTWHQDLTYWGLGETSDQVTAWLALSPATPVSGCMRFVARSHKNAVVPHRDTYSENNLLSRGQEIAVEVKEEDATNIELAPGQLSLHHGLMFHSSGPNQSSDRRIGVAIRYVNPSVRQEVGARDYALLVRGADRVGNFIHFAAPASDFDPADLLLHEEILKDKTAVNYRDVS